MLVEFADLCIKQFSKKRSLAEQANRDKPMDDRIPDLVSAQQKTSISTSEKSINDVFPVKYIAQLKQQSFRNNLVKENIDYKEITELAEPIWKFYKLARYQLPDKDRVENISWRIMSMRSINLQFQDSMNQNKSDNSNNFTNSFMDIPMSDLEMMSDSNQTMHHNNPMMNNNTVNNSIFSSSQNSQFHNDNSNTHVTNNEDTVVASGRTNSNNSNLKNDPLFSSFIKTPVLNGLDVDGLSFSPFKTETTPGNLKKLMKTPELSGIANPNINNQKKVINNCTGSFSLDNNSLSNHLSNLRSFKKNAYDFNFQYDLDSMGFENSSVTQSNINHFPDSSSSFSSSSNTINKQSLNSSLFPTYGSAVGPSTMLENTGSFEIIGTSGNHIINNGDKITNLGVQNSYNKNTNMNQPTTNINPHNMFNINYNSKFSGSYNNSRSNSNKQPSFSNEHMEFDTHIDNNELNNIKKIFEFNPIPSSANLRDNSHDAALSLPASNVLDHNIHGSSVRHSMSDILAISQSRHNRFSQLNLGNNHLNNSALSGPMSIASPAGKLTPRISGLLPNMTSFSASSSSTSLNSIPSSGNIFDTNPSTTTTSYFSDAEQNVTGSTASNLNSTAKLRKKYTSTSTIASAKSKNPKRNSVSSSSKTGISSSNSSSKPVNNNRKSESEPRKKRNSSSSMANPNIECSNCHTKTTPLWRKTPTGLPLCNACGLFLKLHGIVRPLSLKTDVIKKRQRLGSSKKSNNSSTSPAANGNNSSNSNSRVSVNSTSQKNNNAGSNDKKKKTVSTDSKKPEKKTKDFKKMNNLTISNNNNENKKKKNSSININTEKNANDLKEMNGIDLPTDFMTNSFELYGSDSDNLVNSINENTFADMESLSNNIVLSSNSNSIANISNSNVSNYYQDDNSEDNNNNNNITSTTNNDSNNNNSQETNSNNNQNWEWLLKFK